MIVTACAPLGEFLAQSLVEGGDYRPLLAASLEEAEQRLAGEAPAALLVDAQMQPSAQEIIRQLRGKVWGLPALIIPGKAEAYPALPPDLPALIIPGGAEVYPAFPPHLPSLTFPGTAEVYPTPPPELPSLTFPRSAEEYPGPAPELLDGRQFSLPALLAALSELLADRPGLGRVEYGPRVIGPHDLGPHDLGPTATHVLGLADTGRLPTATGRLPWLHAAPHAAERAAQHLARLSLESSALAALITYQGALWAYAGQLPQTAAQELAQIVSHLAAAPFRSESDLARFVRLAATQADYMLYATWLDEATVLALVFDTEIPFSRIRHQAARLARALAAFPSEPRSGPEPDPSSWTAHEAARPGESEQAAYSHQAVSIPPLALDERIPPAAPDPVDEPPILDTEAPVGPLLSFPTDEWTPEVEILGEPGERAPALAPSAPPRQAAPAAPVNPPPGRYTLEVQAEDGLYIPLHELHYAVTLLPRLPQHLLVGDLAHRLGEWMKTLHVAYGWRLEQLAIRPVSLSWVSLIPPETAPAQMITLFCRHTSRHIFEEFPHLAQENPSGEFWAPAYLVITSARLPAPEALKAFSERTRRRQGLLTRG